MNEVYAKEITKIEEQKTVEIKQTFYFPPITKRELRKWKSVKFKPYEKNSKVKIYTKKEITKYIKEKDYARENLPEKKR